MMRNNPIYLATVCIERNRWSRERTSSVDLIEYLPRIADAGFDGLELWEFHASGMNAEQRVELAAAARDHGTPVKILSTYLETIETPGNRKQMEWLNATAEVMDIPAFKFNVYTPSKAPHRKNPEVTLTKEQLRREREDAMDFIRKWAEDAGPEREFLCECHGGSIVEQPDEARRFLEELDHPRFGLITHCFTAPRSECEQEIHAKKPFLRHVHLSKASSAVGPLRNNIEAFPEVVEQLTWSIEFSEPVFQKGDNDACFRAAVGDLKLLRQVL